MSASASKLRISSLESSRKGASVLLTVLLVDSSAGERVGSERAAILLAAHPNLGKHTCRQQGLGLFADKIADASLPHLLEHLTIDSLAAVTNARVAGNTRILKAEAIDAGTGASAVNSSVTVSGAEAGKASLLFEFPAEFLEQAKLALNASLDEINVLFA